MHNIMNLDGIIEKIPSAGLWEGQTDEGDLGITYDELDKTIEAIEGNKTDGINKKVLDKVKKMIESSEHKRCRIPTFVETRGDKK